MPVTPLHFGPALLAKKLSPDHFSLGAFAVTQVVIDTESVSNILLDRWPVHAHLHTVAGSLVVALVVIAVAKAPLSAINRWAARRVEGGDRVAPQLRRSLRPITWTGLIVGALFGALTHILLDGFMHADMEPFAPWNASNPFLFDGGFVWVHGVCFALTIAGVAIWTVRSRQASVADSSRPSPSPWRCTGGSPKKPWPTRWGR